MSDCDVFFADWFVTVACVVPVVWFLYAQCDADCEAYACFSLFFCMHHCYYQV